MTIEEITKTSKEMVDDIMRGRNGEATPNGWSPLSHLLSLKISSHGTAVKVHDRMEYEEIMKMRIDEL